MKIILDDNKYVAALGAMAGLRHIRHTAKIAAQFHAQGKLGNVFASLEDDVSKLLEPAEEVYRTLRALYPTAH
ncbi:hypothetical protein EGT07_23910 [Herbaspirillum sp. HC18]|nr:hypothetical protein EGT07_23910 [Herbaspirillum sp. HC18]